MKSLKHISSLMMLGLMVLLMSACQPKSSQKKSRITGRGADQVNPLTQAPQQSGSATEESGDGSTVWGGILRPQNWTQPQFQQRVQLFLSNITEPDGSPLSLGTVSGDQNQNTGIRFWGKVNVSPNGNHIINSQGSALRISIVDSYVGQTNSDGETITEVPIYIAPGVDGFKSVTGQVQNGQARIIFEDTFGKIILQGQYNSNWFQGTVSFQNNQPAVSSSLGYFVIQTCGFFKCQ